MACNKYVLPWEDGNRHLAYYWCSTEAELPTAQSGDRAFTSDSKKSWVWADDAWAELGIHFPIASVFIGTTPTNPAALVGYGTWVALNGGNPIAALHPLTLYMWERYG